MNLRIVSLLMCLLLTGNILAFQETATGSGVEGKKTLSTITVEGIVLNQFRTGKVFIHDGKDVWMLQTKKLSTSLKVGEKVKAEGKVQSGRFILVADTLMVVGKGQRPDPTPITIAELHQKDLPNGWFRTSGIIEKVSPGARTTSTLELVISDQMQSILVVLQVDQANELYQWRERLLLRPVTLEGTLDPKSGPIPRPIRLNCESTASLLNIGKSAFETTPVSYDGLSANVGKNVYLRQAIVTDLANKDEVELWLSDGHIILRHPVDELRKSDNVDVVGTLQKVDNRYEIIPIFLRVYPVGTNREPWFNRGEPIGLNIEDVCRRMNEGREFQVRLTGEVTAVLPDWDGFFLQSENHGIFVYCPDRMRLPEKGDSIRLQGNTYKQNNFAGVQLEESSKIQKSTEKTYTRYILGSERLAFALESKVVSVEGLVRAIRPIATGTLWTMTRGDEVFEVYLNSRLNESEYKLAIGTTVRTRGVFSNRALFPFQNVGKHLWVSQTNDVFPLQSRIEITAKNISTMLTEFDSGAVSETALYRFQGVVTAEHEDWSFVQDGKGAIAVHWDRNKKPNVGDTVEIVGFLRRGARNSIVAEYAYYTDAYLSLENQKAIPVHRLDSGLENLKQFQLIELSGTVLSLNHNNQTWNVEDNAGLVYSVYVSAQQLSSQKNTIPKVGSFVSLTGVFGHPVFTNSEKDTFEICLRAWNVDKARAEPSRSIMQESLGYGLLGASVLGLVSFLLTLKHRLREQIHITDTQLKLHEELEGLFRELFENANDLLFTLDVEGRITSINTTGCDLLKFSRSELIGKFLSDFVDPDYRNSIENMIESDIPSTEEIVFYDRHGQEVYLEINSRPVMSESLTMHLVGIGRDVTRRKSSEQELRRAYKVLKNHFENSPLAVVEWDRGFRVIRWSAQAEQLFGWKETEILLHEPNEWKFIHPEDLTRVSLIMSELMEKQTRNVSTNRNFTKDGRVVHCEWYNSPLMDENGRVISYLSLVLDVTQRVEAENRKREAEENLRQAQKMEAVGRLAGGVAHDFNNLLTVINGNAQLLVDQNLQRSQHELISQILQAGEKAAALTRQLLAFGRRQIAAPKDLNLNQVLNDLERILRRLASESVELVYDLETPISTVLLDPTMAEQIIFNLVVNARDAMPKGGKVTIRTRDLPNKTGVRLEVQDTGIGMDEKTQSKIFEPFFSTKELGKGTGLGLATVYSIVQQAGGRIEVNSQPNQGALFTIDFPVSVGRASQQEISLPGGSIVGKKTLSSVNKQSVNATSAKILLVEDEDGLRLLARKVLEMNGYKVHAAADAEEALEYLENNPTKFDVLVTDVMMPNVSGVQLAEQVRMIDPALHVIFMSGYTDDEVIHQGVMMEEVHFLQKPFTPASLLEKVRQVLSEAPSGVA